MMHTESHPLAGQTVTVEFAGSGNVHEFQVEDWWDRVSGESWKFSTGNPAALIYAMRAGLNRIPLDDDVVYGHLGGIGGLVHASEIRVESSSEPTDSGLGSTPAALPLSAPEP